MGLQRVRQDRAPEQCTTLRFSDMPEVTDLSKVKPGFKLIIYASVLALSPLSLGA